jgi:toxin ParE1/3/4
MAFKITISPVAEQDIAELIAYIGADDIAAAERMAQRVISRIESLSEFPRLGKITPEFESEELRELLQAPYRIIYRIYDSETRIRVLRVWHGARSTPHLLD